MDEDDELDEDVDGQGGGAADDGYQSAFSDSEEELEDYRIRKSDSIVVAATAHDDNCNLEVYVYDHQTSDLYVHHEIILSAYPLCLQWLPQQNKEKANYVIVGTFLPEIEIWNLDSENCEPLAALGSAGQDEEMKQNSQGKQEFVDTGSHTDAIMSLSLNPI